MSFSIELVSRLKNALAEKHDFFVFGKPNGEVQWLDPTSIDLTVWPGKEPSATPWQHSTNRNSYLKQITELTRLLKQRGGKTVISRAICGNMDGIDIIDVADQFFSAYPSAYRTFFYSRRHGGWLGASPELLFMVDGNLLHTMALAGTLPVSPESEWDDKNIQEHEMVADYVTNCLTACCTHFTHNERSELQYGNIKHLITEFDATVPSDINHLKSMMHPTPAVGGLPREQALTEITTFEEHPRNLYAGLIDLTDPTDGKRYCIVNLRCVHFDHSHFCIYAGGGITALSCPETEWRETERKSSKLQQLFFVKHKDI